jgi:hypothetical protein
MKICRFKPYVIVTSGPKHVTRRINNRRLAGVIRANKDIKTSLQLQRQRRVFRKASETGRIDLRQIHSHPAIPALIAGL